MALNATESLPIEDDGSARGITQDLCASSNIGDRTFQQFGFKREFGRCEDCRRAYQVYCQENQSYAESYHVVQI
jgi:hypothetical protein